MQCISKTVAIFAAHSPVLLSYICDRMSTFYRLHERDDSNDQLAAEKTTGGDECNLSINNEASRISVGVLTQPDTLIQPVIHERIGTHDFQLTGLY